MRNLIDCIDNLYAAELGMERVRKNLGIEESSIVA